jgi:hypothetical protein
MTSTALDSGQACDFAILKRCLPRSFNNTTVASDRESQIASLTPVSSLGGSIKDDESIAAAKLKRHRDGIHWPSSFQTLA